MKNKEIFQNHRYLSDPADRVTRRILMPASRVKNIYGVAFPENRHIFPRYDDFKGFR